MAHVCQQCLGNHALCDCPNKPKPRADTGGKGATEPGSLSGKLPSTTSISSASSSAALVQPLGMGSHLFKGNPKVGEARKQPLRFLRQSPGKSQFSPKVAAEFSPSPPALSGLSAEGSALVSASSSAFSAGLFHLPAGARTRKSPVVSAATEQHPSLAAGVSSSSSVGLHDGKTFRMLYLFSGTKRKADVGWFLRVLCKLHKVTLLLQEFDLCNGEDLSMEEDWAKVLGLIESKGFDLVFSTPPCNGFSRARWANKRGPRHLVAAARAEGEDVRIGGWECLDSDDVGTARWFSEVITRENAPWVFEAGDPFRTIATLELLATLCCLVAFLRVPGPVNVEEPRALLTLGGSTDNLGNKFVVAKLQTTKYPLVCVLMEIAAMLHQAGEGLDLQWVPRLQNIEADQLTNGDFRGFDPAVRVRVNIATQPWVVLNSMLKQGRALYSVIREGRIESSKRKLEKFAGPFVRSQKKSFRERDPWQ
ncbi:unnamed protein product [Polarella glacialis]|uniref:Uncharacterized protein n=1 Tax=Polarella glacialis TaxID=89957 RepID=A0A813IHW6_POLGL|nr:unnamed protein product [Polarella glacialis]